MTLRPSVVAFAAAIAGVAAFGYLGSEFKRDCFNREIHMAGVDLVYFNNIDFAISGAFDAVGCLAR